MGEVTITKKIKIFPQGDAAEKERVYEYIKNGQYAQWRALNLLMSQYQGIAWRYRDRLKEIPEKATEEETKEIEKFNNQIFKEMYEEIYSISDSEHLNNFGFKYVTGLGQTSVIMQKAKKDFASAVKNGLFRGERTLPKYNLNGPLITAGRFVNIFKYEKEIDGDTKECFGFKWVNGIYFDLYTGSRGMNDYLIVELLNAICEKNPNYKICESRIKNIKNNDRKDKDGLYLYLVVKKQTEDIGYKPVKGRAMGAVMGLNKPIAVAISDNNRVLSVGSPEDFTSKRIALQEQERRKRSAMRENRGGKGRFKKTKGMERFKEREKEFAKSYNHILSKNLIKIAVRNNVEVIVLEDISKEKLDKYPIILRNWSIYQLMQYIEYKAKAYGIKVVKSKAENVGKICAKCGAEINIEIPDDYKWQNSIVYNCPKCNKLIEYSYNKAKNMSVMG